ncbi:MAG: universal stress protein [Bdellovibrionota bacterium]
MSKSKKLRIVWAMDAFEESNDTQRAINATLKSISADRSVEILPVYVLNPDSFNLSMELARPWKKYYSEAALNAMKHRTAQVSLPNIGAPEVLFQGVPSLAKTVRRLVSYAELAEADLILLGTHARQGLSRLVLGSFAETALLQSKVPVLIVGPETHLNPLKDLLFPTDLGAKSHQAFKRMMRFAKAWGMKLTILHTMPHPIEPVFQSGVYLFAGSWIPTSEYMSREELKNKKLGERWAQEARDSGVDAEFQYDPGLSGVTQSILDAAQGHSAIAMASQSGPVASAILGSVTRQVVRKAPCPVWVFRV